MAIATFQHQHGAMLLKYSGISFISGAVNHGFFSGERSLWTAAIGIVLFVLGAYGAIGFADDYLKVVRKNTDGLIARWKFGADAGWSGLWADVMLRDEAVRKAVGLI